MGDGASQARKSSSTAESHIDADGSTSNWDSRVAEYHRYPADNDWAADSDYDQGSRRNGKHTSDAEYAGSEHAGHNPERNNSGDDDPGHHAANQSERAQYPRRNALRSCAGNSSAEQFD
jgi:hypothetical protein